MPLSNQTRRGISLFIPLLSALLFWGGITAMTGIGEHENIMSTGITLAGVVGILNAWLWFLIFKHRVP